MESANLKNDHLILTACQPVKSYLVHIRVLPNINDF